MSKQSCSYSSTRNGAENEVEDDSNEHLFDEVDDDASGSDYDDGTDEYEPEDEIQITENIIALAKSMSHVSDDDLLDMIALNKSSQELIQKLIDKTDRSLLDNMEALEEVHEELAALNSPNDASNFKVAIILYDRPYFKDNFGMTAVMNQEAAELIKTHKLPTLLREEVIWKLQELKELKTGVCWSLVSNLNKPLITKEALLSTKIKTFNAANTQEELSQWRAEVVELKRKIDFNKNTPLEELENAGYDNVDWNLIAHRFMDNERTPIQCKQKWLNELCLRINKGPWTDKEDAILKETACHSWTNWKFVVHELGTNRSEFMCIKRAKELYLKIYHEKQVWTPEEDEKLYSIVSSCRNIHSIPWEKVAKLLGSRNALQCKYRFTQSIDTRLHQGRWTDAEDMFLLDAINRYGPLDWAKIASCVPGRTAAQCRTRWVNFLNLEREHKQWTALEDELLLRLIQILGRGKWSQMSLFFPGREPFDLRGRMKYFLTKRAKNKPLTYEDTSYRYKYAHTARIKTMMRFQQLENDSAMTNNEVFKRFGIGSFLLNDDQRPGSFKQKLKEFHIYQSGAYLKSRTTLDRRKARYENFLKTLPSDKRKMLVQLKKEFEERTKQRAEELADREGNDALEFVEKRGYHDSEHLTAMMNEIITVDEHDLKIIEKRKIPRIRIRKYKKNPRKVNKIPKAIAMQDLKKKCEVIRNVEIFPELAESLNLKQNQIVHQRGYFKKIEDLVLLEDHNGQLYWGTSTEDLILRTLLETNKVMIRNSLYQYENTWRKVFNLSQKCQDYFKQKMTVTLPPMIVAPKPRDLNNYKEMLSDVMLPCRGTLMGVSQYRQNYRNNFRIAASKFFDGVDTDGRQVPLDLVQGEVKKLDIRLSKNITESEDYQLLRQRMFKMFFLPMLLEYGQKSKNYKEQLLEQIRIHEKRKHMEDEFENHSFHADVMRIHQSGTVLINASTVAVRSVQPAKVIPETDRKFDETINSVVAKVTSGNVNVDEILDQQNKDLEEIAILNWQEADTTNDASGVQEPPKKKKPRKNAGKNRGIATETRLTDMPLDPSNMEVIVIDPQTQVNAPEGAYKPRWIKSQLQNQEHTADGEREPTLADVLFVKGRKRRAPAGLYDQQHHNSILDTLRPTVLKEVAEQNQDALPISEFDDDRVQIKQEMIEGRE